MASNDLRIIIAGSGIAGLSVAIALELAGLDYTILEQVSTSEYITSSTSDQTKEVTGGAVQVGPTALHFLHQLGIYEEIQKISKPVSGYSMNEHDMSYVGRIDLSTYRERYGYHTEVMSHSQLYALLLQRIPPKRIIPKKILGMIQDKDKVTVRCSDGTTYEGDILIAADGAFSNVRHTLYWNLDEKKQLPKADAEPMSIDMHIISGCTNPLDPTKYPVLLDAMSEIQFVQFPDKPYTVWFVPLTGNRIAWNITRDVDKVAIRQGEASRVNQWRPDDLETMLEVVKSFECPYGGQVGDLIESTPSESIYLNMSEERFCETWYGGRTVLVGDGFFQPVSEAIVDAIILVNLLSNTASHSLESLGNVLKDYKERRGATAKSAVEQCGLMRQVFTGKGRGASLKRSVVFNYMPEKMRYLSEDKRNEDRPQLWFLPQVKDNGIVKPLPNLPSNLGNSTVEGPSSNIEGHVKVSLEAAVNAAANAISSTMTSVNSSPRSSRPSWSSYSRPALSAFSIPSASNVPLFTSSQTISKPTSKQTILKSPRSSTSKSKEEQDFGLKKNTSNDAATSVATTTSEEKAVVAVHTGADANPDGEVAKTKPSIVQMKSFALDDDDLSSDEGEFANCISTMDDDKELVADWGAMAV
ncbi:hypothetical protein BGX21_007362 [Mortierella sp. AD011]|nr:hypothetical protein BGX20_008153 [Mortierella sp. AD010]KAF9403057.1 hypothetical protein BGX21_007362 [Mortierella sp. AD011]